MKTASPRNSTIGFRLFPRPLVFYESLSSNSHSFGVYIVAANTGKAQFKVVGPAPFTETVARQKIRTLLENVNPENRQQTVDTITGWLTWYRDLLDEELMAAWHNDTRANLTELMAPLADPRVASGVIEFSWRQQRHSAFIPAYAPMFENLMTRFAESAKPFWTICSAPRSPCPRRRRKRSAGF